MVPSFPVTLLFLLPLPEAKNNTSGIPVHASLSLQGALGAVTGPRLGGGRELIHGHGPVPGGARRARRPDLVPCTGKTIPQDWKSSPNASSHVGVFGLAFNSNCFRGRQIKRSLSSSLPRTVGLVIPGSRGSHVRVYVHRHSESPILSSYHHTHPCTHMSARFGGLAMPKLCPNGENVIELYYQRVLRTDLLIIRN